MPTSNRLVVLWDYYQHYHLARLRALRAHGGARGWNVTGLAAGQGGARRDSHRSEPPTGDDAPTLLGDPEWDLTSAAAADAFAQRLDELDPSAVLVPGWGTVVARRGLRWCRERRRGAVVIVESQERDFARMWWKEWLKRRIVRQADVAFCGGRLHAAYAEKLGLPPARIHTGYSAVDNQAWAEAAAAARQAPPPIGGPYFVAVGRFVAKKDFVGLIDAFARFHAIPSRQSWSLILVGDGPERAAIEQKIAEHGLGRTIVLVGYADFLETARWLASATALVLPSRASEQWGLVVNEAMATGLPVVVSDICGCAPDLVSEGQTGYTFPAGDRAALTHALQTVATLPDPRRTLGAAARARIADFSLDRFAHAALAAAEAAVAHAALR